MASSKPAQSTSNRPAPVKKATQSPDRTQPSRDGAKRPERPIADVDRKVRGGDA